MESVIQDILFVSLGLPLLAYSLSWVELRNIAVWIVERYHAPHTTTLPRPLGGPDRGNQQRTPLYYIESSTRPLHFTSRSTLGGFTRDLRGHINTATVQPRSSASPAIPKSTTEYPLITYFNQIDWWRCLDVTVQFIDSFWVLFQVLCYIALLLLQLVWGILKTLLGKAWTVLFPVRDSFDSDSNSNPYLDSLAFGPDDSLAERRGVWGWFSPAPHYSRIRLRTIMQWFSPSGPMVDLRQAFEYDNDTPMVSFIIPCTAAAAREQLAAEHERRTRLVTEALSVDRKLRGVMYARARCEQRKFAKNMRNAVASSDQTPVTPSSSSLLVQQPHPFLPETASLLSHRARASLFKLNPKSQILVNPRSTEHPLMLTQARSPLTTLVEPNSPTGIMSEKMMLALYKLVKADTDSKTNSMDDSIPSDSFPPSVWLSRGASVSAMVATVLPNALSQISPSQSALISEAKDQDAAKEADQILREALEHTVAEGKKQLNDIISSWHAKQLAQSLHEPRQQIFEEGRRQEQIWGDTAARQRWAISKRSLIDIYIPSASEAKGQGDEIAAEMDIPGEKKQAEPILDDSKDTRSEPSKASTRLAFISDKEILRRVANALDGLKSTSVDTPIMSDTHPEQTSPIYEGGSANPITFIRCFWSRVGDLATSPFKVFSILPSSSDFSSSQFDAMFDSSFVYSDSDQSQSFY